MNPELWVPLALAAATGLNYLIHYYFTSHQLGTCRDRIRELEDVKKDLEVKLRDAGGETIRYLNVQIAELETKCKDREQENTSIRDQLSGKKHLLELSEAAVGKLTVEKLQLVEQIEASKKDMIQMVSTTEKYRRMASSNAKLVKDTLKLEGKIWVQRPLTFAPPFIPLPERKTPIISMLNLKGGVGKTTLTTYLAWGLVRRGYRVLLVDLDLQGSLSSQILGDLEVVRCDNENRLLRHFLEQSWKTHRVNISDFAVPTDRLGQECHVLATTDHLAYVEMNLTFQWLLRVGKTVLAEENEIEQTTETSQVETGQWTGRKDVRLYLRKALHRKKLRKNYDIVLLDCPPLVNLCCVNALASSDFVIAPVNPSRKSAERVPSLLQRIKEIKHKVNPDLEMMGLVANRTHYRDGLTASETDIWNGLKTRSLDVMGSPVYQFNTTFPQSATIRLAEERDGFPPQDQEIATRVDTLVREIETLLPHYCLPEQMPKQEMFSFEKKEN